MVGGLEALFGLAFGESRAVVLGLSAVTYAAWLARVSLRFGDLRQAETIGRIAAVTLVLVAMAAILEPELAFAMAIASLLPIVLVLPFLGSRAIGRILVIGGIVGLGSVVAGELLPRGDRLPAALSASIASMTLVLVYGFLLIFLWEVSRRMKTTADDLRSVVAMSNDVSRTMDPQLVGDRIARHIALAVGDHRLRPQLLGPRRRPARHPRLLPARATRHAPAVVSARRLPGDAARPRDSPAR